MTKNEGDIATHPDYPVVSREGDRHILLASVSRHGSARGYTVWAVRRAHDPDAPIPAPRGSGTHHWVLCYVYEGAPSGITEFSSATLYFMADEPDMEAAALAARVAQWVFDVDFSRDVTPHAVEACAALRAAAAKHDGRRLMEVRAAARLTGVRASLDRAVVPWRPSLSR